jgi:hypothetical protein
LYGRADFFEEALGHSEHAALQTFGAHEAKLRDDGSDLHIVVGKDEVVGGAFWLRREWYDEHRVAIELANDENWTLKKSVVAILLSAKIDAKGAPPHFAHVDEIGEGCALNLFLVIVPAVEVLLHTIARL